MAIGFDFDNCVDLYANDLGLMAINWQTSVAAAPFDEALGSLDLDGSAVPEPAAGFSLLALAALFQRRRRMTDFACVRGETERSMPRA